MAGTLRNKLVRLLTRAVGHASFKGLRRLSPRHNSLKRGDNHVVSCVAYYFSSCQVNHNDRSTSYDVCVCVCMPITRESLVIAGSRNRECEYRIASLLLFKEKYTVVFFILKQSLSIIIINKKTRRHTHLENYVYLLRF